jgi:hypothetical protein
MGYKDITLEEITKFQEIGFKEVKFYTDDQFRNIRKSLNLDLKKDADRIKILKWELNSCIATAFSLPNYRIVADSLGPKSGTDKKALRNMIQAVSELKESFAGCQGPRELVLRLGPKERAARIRELKALEIAVNTVSTWIKEVGKRKIGRSNGRWEENEPANLLYNELRDIYTRYTGRKPAENGTLRGFKQFYDFCTVPLEKKYKQEIRISRDTIRRNLGLRKD